MRSSPSGWRSNTSEGLVLLASDLSSNAPPTSLGTPGEEGQNSAGFTFSILISPQSEKDVDDQKPAIGGDYFCGSKQSMDNFIITQDCCFEISGEGRPPTGKGQQWADRSFCEAT